MDKDINKLIAATMQEEVTGLFDSLVKPVAKPSEKIDKNALEDLERIIKEMPEPEFKRPTLFSHRPSHFAGIPIIVAPKSVRQSVKAHRGYKRWMRRRNYHKRIQKKWDKRYGFKYGEIIPDGMVIRTAFGLVMTDDIHRRILSCTVV